MADWETRLREAAYTSPSGVRILFQYEDVAREGTFRGTVFEFPGVDDAYVQRTGNGPRRYPLRCYFSGPDHDLEASAFMAALFESSTGGVGLLEHPRWKRLRVVPFGDWNQRDDLKTAANQSIIEVTFWTTVGAVYPTADPNPQNEILAQIAGFNVAAAQQFARATSLTSAVNKAATAATITSMLRDVGGALDSVSDSVASVRQVVQDAQDAINLGIDVLIGKPLELAEQICDLVQAPARALTGIEIRLNGYAEVASSMFGSSAGRPGERIDETSVLLSRRNLVGNDFHSADLFAMNALAGSIITVTAQPLDDAGRVVRAPIFQTRPQALAAAETLLAQLEALVEWRDDAFAALAQLPAVGGDQLDLGGAYQALRQAVGLTTGNLVRASLSLLPEKAITLDRARTIIDVAAQVYGQVDSRLDFLIETNKLTGDEILELPPGRKIVYYDAA